MSVTRCVGSMARLLGTIPPDKARWREELEKMPESCPHDCSPGGCRKHCTEYARGAWVRSQQLARKKK